jgi:hypothetical protein
MEEYMFKFISGEYVAKVRNGIDGWASLLAVLNLRVKTFGNY